MIFAPFGLHCRFERGRLFVSVNLAALVDLCLAVIGGWFFRPTLPVLMFVLIDTYSMQRRLYRRTNIPFRLVVGLKLRCTNRYVAILRANKRGGVSGLVTLILHHTKLKSYFCHCKTSTCKHIFRNFFVFVLDFTTLLLYNRQCKEGAPP